jgi:hypothetical protein
MVMKIALAAVVLLAATAVGLTVWLWPRGEDGRPRPGSRLRVLFSGETLGEIEPCNCSGKMAGGLPARGGYIESQRGDRLLVDTGCVGNGARDFEMIRTEATLRGMAAMGYDAANIGETELWVGRQGLARLAEVGVPFVSANVRATDGETVAPAYLSFKRSGLKVAVTGAVEADRYQLGPGLAVDPPREALARLIPRLREEAGVIIVLADLTEAAVRELAADFPEIAMILYRGRGDSHAPELVNRTVIASIYGEARYLGDVTLEWPAAGRVAATGEAVLLDERFDPSEKVTAASVSWYKDEVRGRMFDLSQPAIGWQGTAVRRPEPGNRYVGSASCATCHARIYEQWQATPHARAMESLQKAGYDYSPECIVCHSIGYGATDGYVSIDKTPEFGRVGCESCHGRGQALLQPPTSTVKRGAAGGEAGCRVCHTPKRQPDFNFAPMWTKFKHGEKP